MTQKYQARWISKKRRDALKRSGSLGIAVLLDSSNGFLVVEPIGSNLGDGEILSSSEVDCEIRDAWCLDSKRKLNETRRLLGLSRNAKTFTPVRTSYTDS